ncbi:MAG TPA: caspase family protein [Polyangia bacterium]|nr:caspase family protein [Polyangia bacterium]
MKSVPLVQSLLKLALGAALAAALGGPARAAEGPLSVAIVVGSNQSPSSSLENLRYGDDDAVQNARTFSLLGAQTTLLVSPDAETRELNPTIHPQAAATRAALRKAFDDARATLAAAHAAGRKTELYFLFAGHGDKADGRPFLQVDDGRIYREDLAEMLRAAGADENHVLVDACYAASFVSDRGPGGTRESLPSGFSRAQVAWPKRTGFLTARSSGGQTHEWAEYQSGVFSHELRSGLMGAADVNVDGKVTYREIAAFVRRANEAIPNRRYRPEVSTIPPGGDLDTALAELPAGPMVLELDTPSSGRSYVETETGLRLADFHASPGARIMLHLPTDVGGMFVEQIDGQGSSATREFRVAPQAGGHILLSSLTPEPTPVRARGAGHEAFLHLFAQPFDLAAVTAFQLDDTDAAELRWDKEVQDARARQSFRRKLALGAFGVGLATGVTSGAFFLSGHNLTVQAETPGTPAYSMGGVSKAQPTIDRRYLTGAIFGSVAGASIVTGALLYFWPSAPNVSVGAAPGCEACLAYQHSF